MYLHIWIFLVQIFLCIPTIELKCYDVFFEKSMTCDFSLLTAELQELQIFWPVFGQLFLILWELIGCQWKLSTSVGKRIFQNKKVDIEKGWPKTCDICIETTQGMEIFRISAPMNDSSVFSCTDNKNFYTM